jgi:hypothetical protein
VVGDRQSFVPGLSRELQLVAGLGVSVRLSVQHRSHGPGRPDLRVVYAGKIQAKFRLCCLQHLSGELRVRNRTEFLDLLRLQSGARRAGRWAVHSVCGGQVLYDGGRANVLGVLCGVLRNNRRFSSLHAVWCELLRLHRRSSGQHIMCGMPLEFTLKRREC